MSHSHHSPQDSPDVSGDHVDVAIVGGGAAGLAAALVLARSRRSVVVVDAGEQRNAPAAHMHNYLGREGVPPLELVAIGRGEVEQYGARVVEGRVESARALGPDAATDGSAGSEGEPSFEVRVSDGTVLHARRVVLATGIVDELPDVPGLAERWGVDVLHCPYCHGWEVRDQRIGVLATSPAGLHHAGLFRQLSESVTVLAQGVDLPPGAREPHAVRGVRFVDGPVVEVLSEDDRLTGVRLEGGDVVPLDALVVAPFFRARTEVAEQLGVGVKDVEMGDSVIATALAADPMTGATDVPGVFVVGNAGNPMSTVIASSASGTQTGAFVNAMLVAEDQERAVAAHLSTYHEPEAWDERYGGDERVWSGKVNPQLPLLTADLAPGRAVDLGCGEGGDVLWLADRGWEATGVDFSATGLEHAAVLAEQAGVAERTTWEQADLRTWTPDGRQWDLVTSHYLHLPSEHMAEVVRNAAAAVATGGTLVVVGHHPDDVGPASRHRRDMMWLAEELAEHLDPATFDVRTEVAERTGTGHGRDVVVRDAVLVARRRA